MEILLKRESLLYFQTRVLNIVNNIPVVTANCIIVFPGAGAASLRYNTVRNFDYHFEDLTLTVWFNLAVCCIVARILVSVLILTNILISGGGQGISFQCVSSSALRLLYKGLTLTLLHSRIFVSGSRFGLSDTADPDPEKRLTTCQ
jgi:hypothetical protein